MRSLDDTDLPPIDGGDREHLPLHETRAATYDMLANGATLGTVCEWTGDDWTWVVVTGLPDEPPEGIDFDGRDVVRFAILDKLPDTVVGELEQAIGCVEHTRVARSYQGHDATGKYMARDEFTERFEPLGPLHPEYR